MCVFFPCILQARRWQFPAPSSSESSSGSVEFFSVFCFFFSFALVVLASLSADFGRPPLSSRRQFLAVGQAPLLPSSSCSSSLLFLPALNVFFSTLLILLSSRFAFFSRLSRHPTVLPGCSRVRGVVHIDSSSFCSLGARLCRLLRSCGEYIYIYIPSYVEVCLWTRSSMGWSITFKNASLVCQTHLLLG